MSKRITFLKTWVDEKFAQLEHKIDHINESFDTKLTLSQTEIEKEFKNKIKWTSKNENAAGSDEINVLKTEAKNQIYDFKKSPSQMIYDLKDEINTNVKKFDFEGLPVGHVTERESNDVLITAINADIKTIQTKIASKENQLNDLYKRVKLLANDISNFVQKPSDTNATLPHPTQYICNHEGMIIFPIRYHPTSTYYFRRRST